MHQMTERATERGQPVYSTKCGKKIIGVRERPMSESGVTAFYPSCPDCLAVMAEYRERRKVSDAAR